MDIDRSSFFVIVKGKDMITATHYAICVQKGGIES